jgi:putative transposase
MLKLGTSYSMFFNKKYDRSGALFEGSFKSQFVDHDVYMRYLFAYIHLNPLKCIDKEWKEKGLRNVHASVKYLHEYTYSSLPDYLSDSGPVRNEAKIIDKDLYGDLFNEKKVVLETLGDWFIKASTP